MDFCSILMPLRFSPRHMRRRSPHQEGRRASGDSIEVNGGRLAEGRCSERGALGICRIDADRKRRRRQGAIWHCRCQSGWTSPTRIEPETLTTSWSGSAQVPISLCALRLFAGRRRVRALVGLRILPRQFALLLLLLLLFLCEFPHVFSVAVVVLCQSGSFSVNDRDNSPHRRRPLRIRRSVPVQVLLTRLARQVTRFPLISSRIARRRSCPWRVPELWPRGFAQLTMAARNERRGSTSGTTEPWGWILPMITLRRSYRFPRHHYRHT
jgi:hypothetical protein